MKRARQVLGLFFQFMKFGLFTFGGGWSIVAQMQKLYVEQEKVITSEELLDLTSVGRSLPGTMIGNVAMLYGYRVAGVAGGMACLFGMILPPLAALAAMYVGFCAFGVAGMVLCPMALLFVKQLHDSGWLRLWK